MKMSTLLLASALIVFGGNAWAQPAAYPNKTIRLVVGFAPAGAADYVARVMSDEFGKALSLNPGHAGAQANQGRVDERLRR